MLGVPRSLVPAMMVGLISVVGVSHDAAGAEMPGQTDQAAGPSPLQLLPEFQCELKPVKASADSTTRDRHIRRIKRTYKKCIANYKAGLSVEQQKLRDSLPAISEKQARDLVMAKIDLMQKVLDTRYQLPEILGAGENSLDARDFYDSAHGH